jgi:hypothetical protein
MLKPEDCAEKFLEYLLENKESFVMNIYGNYGMKISTRHIGNFVVENCLPNGFWKKSSYRSRFYKHLKLLLRLLGYEMRFDGNGIVRRLVITKVPILNYRIKALRRMRKALNLGSRVDNSLY